MLDEQELLINVLFLEQLAFARCAYGGPPLGRCGICLRLSRAHAEVPNLGERDGAEAAVLGCLL